MRNLILLFAGVVAGMYCCIALAVGGSFWLLGWNGMMRDGDPGGMMGGAPAESAPPDDHRAVDGTITITAQAMRFNPERVIVNSDQMVRFVIDNKDGFAHNFVGQQAGIGERIVAGGTRSSLVWTAPSRPGTYRAICTYHPNMTVWIDVRQHDGLH